MVRQGADVFTGAVAVETLGVPGRHQRPPLHGRDQLLVDFIVF